MVRKLAARPASREAGLVSLILAGALGLRLLGVGQGLPYIQNWDEPFMLSPVVQMFQRGDLNPGQFAWGSVYYYIAARSRSGSRRSRSGSTKHKPSRSASILRP